MCVCVYCNLYYSLVLSRTNAHDNTILCFNPVEHQEVAVVMSTAVNVRDVAMQYILLSSLY